MSQCSQCDDITLKGIHTCGRTSPIEFEVKDSGARKEFASGMVRDITEGKMRPDLVRSGPMLMRWIVLMTKGAIKYTADNWMKANGREEHDRFLESADRHYFIWYNWRQYGINYEDMDNPTTEPLAEDHAAAVFFNINGTEYVAAQLEKGWTPEMGVFYGQDATWKPGDEDGSPE